MKVLTGYSSTADRRHILIFVCCLLSILCSKKIKIKVANCTDAQHNLKEKSHLNFTRYEGNWTQV
jgi:hypothetical protein